MSGVSAAFSVRKKREKKEEKEVCGMRARLTVCLHNLCNSTCDKQEHFVSIETLGAFDEKPFRCV